ncbi:hypothetical protein Goari_025439, partial [Gossypium aridum]|nr:hypothetical protein [Gossypium aridum]
EPSSSSSSAWRLPSAPRTIRRGSNSSSAARHETEVTRQSSAPLNIPDWSKIYGKHANMEPSRNESWVNTGDDDGDDDDDGMVYEDGDMVPPHEWLARKLARTRVSSFSVCEGMGRTLKGRDLSKVQSLGFFGGIEKGHVVDSSGHMSYSGRVMGYSIWVWLDRVNDRVMGVALQWTST